MSSSMDLIVGLTCASFVLVPVLLLLWLMVVTLRLNYRSIGRSLIRPRFGVKALFLLTAVVAVDLALVRALGINPSSSDAIWAGPLFFVLAVAVVGFVWLVVRDFSDTFTTTVRGSDRHDRRRNRSKEP